MNEEDRIGDCLASLAFCDEIVVIDSHSRDRTRDIAREHGARVIERDCSLLHYPYRSFAEHLRTIDKYTTIMARGMYARGRRAGFSDYASWIRFCQKVTMMRRPWLCLPNWQSELRARRTR